jgi:mannose-6-phosphate isomerase-like protein (cupin superfamily)
VEVNGLHVNVKDVAGEEVAPGAVERVLLSSVDGGLEVRHFTLSEGGSVEFSSPLTEYQHYVIQGCATQNGQNGSLLHQDSAWFVPCNAPWGGEPVRRHSLHHAGEGDVRVLSISYRVSRPAFRWAKSRSRNLHEVPRPHSAGRLVGYVQIFREEDHAAMGALRMHGVDIQTNTVGVSLPDHRNPEEVMYVLRGQGVAFSDGESYEIAPGSMVYTPEGAVHGIRSVEETLQYLVVEFVDHPGMWLERGYAEEWKPSWEQP